MGAQQTHKQTFAEPCCQDLDVICDQSINLAVPWPTLIFTHEITTKNSVSLYFLKDLFLTVCVCVSVLCLCVEMHTWVQVFLETGGIRCLWSQWQVVVNCPMWVLRMQPGSSTRAVSALSCWLISSALFQMFILFMLVVRVQIFILTLDFSNSVRY